MGNKALILFYLTLLLGVCGLAWMDNVGLNVGLENATNRSVSLSQYKEQFTLSFVEADMQWDQTYGGVLDDLAYSVIQTTDGGFALTGSTSSFGVLNNYDGWLVKTDSHGVMEWDQTYGEFFDDSTYSVIQTGDGGFVLAGFTSNSRGGGDAWLVKTDKYGFMKWNQTYGDGWFNDARSVIQTMDDGFVLVGSTLSFGANNFDGFLVKTDANGVMQWNQTYGGLGRDKSFSVIQTMDGGFALAGYTTSSGVGDENCWLVKTDASGTIEWTQTYGGAGEERANAIIQTGDGGFILIGHTTSFDAVISDAWLVKTDSHGEMEWNKLYGDSLLEWDKLYGGSSWDEAHSVIQTVDGRFVLAGYTYSFDGRKDAWLMKIDAYGVMEWNKIVGGSEDDIVNAVIQATDGSYVLAGSTFSFGAGGRDAWLVKTDPPGIASPARFIYNLAIFILFATFTIIRLWKKVPYIYGLIVLVVATITVLKLWKKRR